MKHVARWLFVTGLVSLSVAACGSDLSSLLEGAECDPAGACIAGYMCDTTSNVCVRPGTIDASSEGQTICSDGETMCGGKCFVLAGEPVQCGACSTLCPVPNNATATCFGGVCDFACREGFAKCGTQCAQLANDVNHCGSCTKQCDYDESCVVGKCKSDNGN